MIAETGIDVVEAYTPPPVGELSLPEVRAAWGDKTIIWVNIPETIFWFGAEEAKRYTIDLLKSGAPGNALVLSFTEMGMWARLTRRRSRPLSKGRCCDGGHRGSRQLSHPSLGGENAACLSF